MAPDVTHGGADPDFSLMAGRYPAALRPHLRAFGRFVRCADDLADDVLLNRSEKSSRLAALEVVLDGGAAELWSDEVRSIADRLCDSLRQTRISAEHPRHLLQAFRRDADGYVCETWPDLMAYCQFAAAPIGRYILALTEEDAAACGRPADALSAALRILKRLRDCGDPTVSFNRLCIPSRFLDDAMITPAHLRAPTAKGQTRAVLDRVLDGVDALLDEAESLPRLVRRHGPLMHTAIVLCRARKLARRFRQGDPLRGRVSLDRWQRALCGWAGTLRAAGRS